jgi:hypothetical protein
LSNKVKMVMGALVLVLVLTTMIATAVFAAPPGWSGNSGTASAYCGQENCGVATTGGICQRDCNGAPGQGRVSQACGGPCGRR